MTQSDATVWAVIVGLGIGTFLIRFSFLGLVGDRPLPNWLLRLLRYTPVAVMPGLVAPLILWPEATGGTLDPARLAAAAVTLGVGLYTRNVVASVLVGMVTLFALLALIP
ncbi:MULTISPECIES: AzlD domain-containing protein [unclassified Meridianimarinicoccus]|uniref:AzlD domain-containing protein n=1 Tax=unclassified Meridianimarinicoccus TaxID=2923344 RepID=UPI0018687EA4|nr:AzlD domain-containing protein [Fluviibacterium sp. MJW13]